MSGNISNEILKKYAREASEVFMEDPDEFEEDVEIGLGKEMLGL